MGGSGRRGGVIFLFFDRFCDAFELASLPFKGPDLSLGMKFEANSMVATVARYIPQTPIIKVR